MAKVFTVISAACAGADRATEILLEHARGVPPEFAADALLRITKLVSSREQKIDVVEEAFRLAALAQLPWPVHGRGFHTDTRLGWRAFASDTGLNSLELQARAIATMRTLDAKRIGRLFA